MSMTRSAVKTEISHLAPENKRSDTDTNTLINDKQKIVAQDTECLRKSVSQILEADTQEYTQTTPIIRIISAIFYDVSAGIKPPLDIETEKSLDDKYPGWRTADSGTPIAVYFRNNVVGTYPTADTDDDYLYLDSVVEPDNLSSNNSTLFELDSAQTYQIELLNWMVVWLCVEQIKRERGFNDKADVYANHSSGTGLYYEARAKVSKSVYIKQDAKREDTPNVYSYWKTHKLH